MFPAHLMLLVFAVLVAALPLNALPPTPLEIAGGREAMPNEANYVAYINGCTGSLISKNYVITAAHCADKDKDLIVYLGEKSIFTLDNATARSVTEVNIHPGYLPYPNLRDDLVLLKLNVSVETTNKISMITLPSKRHQSVTYSELTAYGWGQQGDNVASSSVRTVGLKVVLCNNFLDKTIICTSMSEGKSTCKGDSGAPLAGDGDVLVAVDSRGKCGYDPVYRNIHTRVDQYLDWIKEKSDAVVPD